MISILQAAMQLQPYNAESFVGMAYDVLYAEFSEYVS